MSHPSPCLLPWRFKTLNVLLLNCVSEFPDIQEVCYVFALRVQVENTSEIKFLLLVLQTYPSPLTSSRNTSSDDTKPV